MSSKNQPHKILFAVGGTGGHLFPAQALARELKEHDPGCEILFAGGDLGTNPFFHKLKFPFREVTSASPFYSNPIKASFLITRGVREGLDLLKEFSFDLIVGFGSFYSFPLLVAARMKKVPYVLVESNAFPGKVNRLFSSKARYCAIQFDDASRHLKGKTTSAKMPYWSQESDMTYLHPSEARKYYQLDPNVFTLLVFGGSQGAKAINDAASAIELSNLFQVLHFCGKDEDADALAYHYKKRGITACVKPFEAQMHIAWRAADLAICRAGAGTLAEIEAFEMPAILIPCPDAADRHQEKNAEAMEKLGGAILLNQGQLRHLSEKIEVAKNHLPQMKEKLQKLKMREAEPLRNAILKELESIG